jgi:hypothetical protein
MHKSFIFHIFLFLGGLSDKGLSLKTGDPERHFVKESFSTFEYRELNE